MTESVNEVPAVSQVDQDQFQAALLADGFTPVLREWEPNVHNASHSHPFEVRALVLAGEMKLSWEGQTQVCKAGDVFTMRADCPHEEWFGATGATFISGRKAVA
jgi:quercetin dioxygenase-like cupin family protein